MVLLHTENFPWNLTFFRLSRVIGLPNLQSLFYGDMPPLSVFEY